MGRDNEFKYKKPDAASLSKSVQDNSFANAGANLRKHHFKFGFDAPYASKEVATAAEKVLYE